MQKYFIPCLKSSKCGRERHQSCKYSSLQVYKHLRAHLKLGTLHLTYSIHSKLDLHALHGTLYLTHCNYARLHVWYCKTVRLHIRY
jgi:hypothetical protein